MRQKISEKNNERKIDFKAEYLRLEKCISGTALIIQDNPTKHFSIEEYIQQKCFNDWDLRHTFINIRELREEYGIDRNLLNSVNYIPEYAFLDYIQFVANCVQRVEETILLNDKLKIVENGQYEVISDNINIILKKMNCELVFEESSGECYIIYCDEVAEIVASNNISISESISKYRRIDSKGDLIVKGDILRRLSLDIENIRATTKGTQYMKLLDDTTFLLNKAGIRHSIDNSKANQIFRDMEDSEREKWFDRAFQSVIACFAVNNYLEFSSEIDDVKKGEV